MNQRLILYVLLIASAVTIVALLARRRWQAPTDAPSSLEIPALAVDDEEEGVLNLQSELTENPGERRLRLQLDGGEATLVLRETSASDEHGVAFGKAVLEPAADRARGAKLVESIARWLEVDLPPSSTGQGALLPVPLGYVSLGSDDEWEANKLFLELGRRQAEVFVNVAADGRSVRLVEKDEEYREDLVAMLALILRDGVPPRRTPENDPNLDSSDPAASNALPVRDAEKVKAGAWLQSGYLGTRRIDGKKTALMLWSNLGEAPRAIATIEGWVTRISPAPRSNLAALTVVYPQSEGYYSSNDPMSLLVLDAQDGSLSELMNDGRNEIYPVWAPDRKRIAGRAWDSSGKSSSTRVFEVATKELIATSDAALDALPARWDTQGLVLQQFTFDQATMVTKHFRWLPGTGSPVAIATEPHVSPDARYQLTIGPDAIEVTGDGKHTLAFARADDKDALEALRENGELAWVGGHQLMLELDEPMLVDLATRRMRFLFRERSLRFESASPDGHTVLARNADERLLWAQIPAR